MSRRQRPKLPRNCCNHRELHDQPWDCTVVPPYTHRSPTVWGRSRQGRGEGETGLFLVMTLAFGTGSADVREPAGEEHHPGAAPSHRTPVRLNSWQIGRAHV